MTLKPIVKGRDKQEQYESKHKYFWIVPNVITATENAIRSSNGDDDNRQYNGKT